MKIISYEHRVVAFLDILGFRNLLEESVDAKGNDAPEAIGALSDLFATVRRTWDLDSPDLRMFSIFGSKQVTTFSDCIAISFLANEPDQLFYMLSEIKDLLINLTFKGVLCRGAITIGKLVHTETVIFGPALAEAYTLESKAAVYPRVIVDKAVIRAASKGLSSQTKPYIDPIFATDLDGMLYIDYFGKAQEELDDPEYDFPQYINALGEMIRKGLQGAGHPKHADRRVKYFWMREKYNQMVRQIHQSLENASVDPELKKLYSSLKEISPNRLHA